MPGMAKRTITDEHREEARKLRELWAQRLPALKLAGQGTQESFGQAYSIGNQAAVGFFLNGKVALSLKAALAFARGLGVPVSEFSPRLAAMMAGDEATTKVVHVTHDEAAILAALRALPIDAKGKVAAFVAGLGAATPQAQVPVPALTNLSRVEPADGSPRAEVDPRKLEDVLGGLFELTGQPRKQARAAGRKLTLEMTAPRPPSSEPSPPGQPVHQPSATPRPSETSE